MKSLFSSKIDVKQFRKIKKISEDCFDIVYKVERKKTREIFSMGIYLDDEEKFDEMTNEINIIMHVDHPAIIKIFGYSKIEKNLILLMEHSKNGSFQDVLEQMQVHDDFKGYNNTARQIIITGIACGMKFLHDQNIIHHNLKAKNVLLDEYFHPHLTDFWHPFNQAMINISFSYQAPEVLENAEYDSKSDVYSFAILMFEVLTESFAYPELKNNTMTKYAFKNKIINEHYRPKFDVPIKESFRILIESCWSAITNERPTFREIFEKLANNSDYLLDDVDKEEFNSYVNYVSNTTDRLLSKIYDAEEEINKLRKQNILLKEDNKELKSENKQLKKEMKQIQTNKNQEENEKQIKKEKKQTKNKNKQPNDEQKSETKNEFNFHIDFDQTKNQTIIVAGNNEFNRLGDKSNNKNKDECPIIFPPLNLSFESSSFLSYSVSNCLSVAVKNDGSLLGVGYNGREEKEQFTEFSIKDKNGHNLTPVSSVCCNKFTLYLVTKNEGKGHDLVFCDCEINNGNPIVLEIDDEEEPIALFGGFSHAAAISNKGKVIFINRQSIIHSSKLRITAVSLPESEKASCLACCEKSIVALSSNGKVFISSVDLRSSFLKFSEAFELDKHQIIHVSGNYNHFLAVSKEGEVFGRGLNNDGQLGIGKHHLNLPIFMKIYQLEKFDIAAAYAGSFHSLFQTRDGKILSCGSNKCGELLLSSGPCNNVYSPTETMITEGAVFCIAGFKFSAIFIGNFPSNSPNMRIQKDKC